MWAQIGDRTDQSKKKLDQESGTCPSSFLGGLSGDSLEISPLQTLYKHGVSLFKGANFWPLGSLGPNAKLNGGYTFV